MYYAQLDENNICIGVSQLSGEVKSDNLIQIASYDTSILGKKYVDGKWEEVPEEPIQAPEPTEQELLQAELLLAQQEIILNQQTQEQALAEILLGQQGGIENV